MGIFNTFDDAFAVSEDWKLFEQQFPYIGAFLYLHERHEAILDNNCYQILRIDKEADSGMLRYERLTEVMQEITSHPVAREKQLYSYCRDGEEVQFRISFVERDAHSWMGIIQDITAFCEEYGIKRDAAVFDQLTQFYTHDAFMQRVPAVMEQEKTEGCMAIVHIHGIEQLAQQFGYSQNDRCLIAISRAMRRVLNERAMCGVRSFKEFFLYMPGCSMEQAAAVLSEMRIAISGCEVMDDFGEVLSLDPKALRMSVGFCNCPAGNGDLNLRINHANFALFEAMTQRLDLSPFSPDRYQKDRDDYNDLQNFRKLVNENLFTYHFQPIVDARTGEIFAFEALMRGGDVTGLPPLKILELAEKDQRLYAIEYATMFNVLREMSRNQDTLCGKKVFINAIPSHQLSNLDFEKLHTTYGELMEQAVIEITEQTDTSQEGIDLQKLRCHDTNSELAIDDYGSGYSNTSSLLMLMPNYVKIDRSLLSGIEDDMKKQHLVADIINFSHENAITVLAEGVETAAELRTVIRLGVDLIQGFYTSRPKPFFVRQISANVKDEIQQVNLETRRCDVRTYVPQNEACIALTKLALDGYTGILVKQPQLILTGSPVQQVQMSITIEEGASCTMTIQNLNLRSENRPTIILGENAQLTLIVEGENQLEQSGILVPATAKLIVRGSGTLNIIADAANCFGIGNDFEHSYGEIRMQSAGKVSIFINGAQCVGIGGGNNPANSLLALESGEIEIGATGIDCVSVGNYSGDARIAVGDCALSINSNAANAVGVGTFRGNAEIVMDGHLSMTGSGSKMVGVGVLARGTGAISMQHAQVNMTMNARFITGIGTTAGEMQTTVEYADIALNCEGAEIAGIGDTQGNGAVILRQTTLDLQLRAATIMDIGSPSGSLLIEGGRKLTRGNE